MDFKPCFLLGLVCLVSAVYTSDNVSDGISPQTGKEFGKAIQHLEALKKQIAGEVNVVKQKVRSEINSALKPFREDYKKLRDDVEERKENAEKSKKDISECVKGTIGSLKKLDRKAVEKCKIVKEFRITSTALGEFAHLIRLLASSEDICAKKGGDLDACVKQQINKYTQESKELQKTITEALKQVNPEEPGRCTRSEVEKLEKEVSGIREKWQQCLKKHE